MKQPSVYLKMRALGAVDTVDGRTRHERMLNVAAMTFLDEEGHPRQFTWRTIQTWFYRYKNHGITGMTNHTRKDKGHTRKLTPEELLEALNAAKPHFHNARSNKRALYRFCIENGLLHPDLSLTALCSHFGPNVAELSSECRNLVTPRIWLNPHPAPRTPLKDIFIVPR
jgi:hypothetical protein